MKYPVSVFVFLLAIMPSLMAVGAASDVVEGKRVFTACLVCHSIELPTKTTLDLRGVIGRKAGTVPGFRYSRAMKNSRIIWDEMSLDNFLAEPQAVVPGNVMPFPGLPDALQRRDVIAYLKTLKPVIP